MLTLFFTTEPNAPVENFEQATACDTERFKIFFHAMLDAGVYLPPSQFEALFLGCAHTVEQIDQTIEAAARALRGVS
jgi:glutamate-1-semialdehyde 2,1-aminomutase